MAVHEAVAPWNHCRTSRERFGTVLSSVTEAYLVARRLYHDCWRLGRDPGQLFVHLSGTRRHVGVLGEHLRCEPTEDQLAISEREPRYNGPLARYLSVSLSQFMAADSRILGRQSLLQLISELCW